MPKTYRVAVIWRTGKGNYGHGLDVVWNAVDNVEVVAVAENGPTPGISRSAAFASAYGAVRRNPSPIAATLAGVSRPTA